MNHTELQTRLKQTGRYTYTVDGIYGNKSRAAVLLALTDGPDTKLTDQDYTEAAARLGVTAAHVKAVASVESAGAGFAQGRPLVLFEPHRFSKATRGKFDVYPYVSYPKWDRSKYPKTQTERYDQLLTAVGLDVDAGFASASYGRFQILGENFKACGYASPYDFAIAQAYDEETQLMAFENFIKSRGLLRHLVAKDWAAFAAGYNGSAYRENKYDAKLEAAFKALGGK